MLFYISQTVLVWALLSIVFNSKLVSAIEAGDICSESFGGAVRCDGTDTKQQRMLTCNNGELKRHRWIAYKETDNVCDPAQHKVATKVNLGQFCWQDEEGKTACAADHQKGFYKCTSYVAIKKGTWSWKMDDGCSNASKCVGPSNLDDPESSSRCDFNN